MAAETFENQRIEVKRWCRSFMDAFNREYYDYYDFEPYKTIEELFQRPEALQSLKFCPLKPNDLNMISQYKYNNTLLSTATKGGHYHIVQYLIDNGADINQGDYPPLYLAVEGGHCDMVQYLLDHGADINQGDYPPLYLAAKEGYIDIFTLLLKRGANIHQLNINNAPILYKTAQHGHIDIVKLLILAGAEINAVNKDGYTALYAAVSKLQWPVLNDVKHKNYIEIIKLLLDAGADVSIASTKYKESLISWIAQTKDIEVATILAAYFSLENIDDVFNQPGIFGDEKIIVNPYIATMLQARAQGLRDLIATEHESSQASETTEVKIYTADSVDIKISGDQDLQNEIS